jgi:hypothetical protein
MLNLTSLLMLFMFTGGVAHAAPTAPGDRADNHQSGPTAPDRDRPRNDASGPRGGNDSARPGNRASGPRGNRHTAPGSRAGTRHNRPGTAHHGVRHGHHSKARPPAHRPRGDARHVHQHHNGHDWRWELGHWVGLRWMPGHWVIVIRL